MPYFSPEVGHLPFLGGTADLSTTLPFVISTGAWRDLRFYGPVLEMFFSQPCAFTVRQIQMRQ